MSTVDETFLRSLDAAEPVTAEQRRRAAAVLDRIVTTAPNPARPRRRLVLVAAAAAAALAGGALVALSGGTAYGSWTSVPRSLNAGELARIGAKCLDEMSTGKFDSSRATVELAERRGEYAVLLFRTTDPNMSGVCMAHNVPGSDDVDHVTWGAGTGSDPSQVVPARDFSDGALSDFRGASVTEGLVGADVVAVTIHARKLTAQATVTDGRYVAWWPGPSFEEKNGQPVDFLVYDLTLRDGTILRGAKPVH